MKRFTLTATLLIFCTCIALAQRPTTVAKVQTVITAENDFAKLVARKGIKEAFLSVADPEGIVFKPDLKKISDFYGSIDKQPGTLTWTPKYARMAANGDLAFTAGPYVFDPGTKKDDDKVYGEYVSVWRKDTEGKLRLLIDLGIQHPESDAAATIDMKEPDTAKRRAPSKEAFAGKKAMTNYDIAFNEALTKSAMGTYREFMSPAGRLYFPGYEPIVGVDRTMKFLGNEAIAIAAENLNAGRAASNDLGYTYGKARIKKGNVVSNFYYVRIWEIDAKNQWNMLMEIFSAVER